MGEGIFTIDVDPSSGVRELSGDGIISFFLKLMNTSASEQVSVSAKVESTLTFSITDNTIFFGILKSTGSCWAQGADPGNVSCPTTSETEAHDIVAGTNATGGYVITMSGNTLTSGLNTITALGDTNTVPSSGSEQFGVRFVASGGTGAVTAPYADAGYAFDTTQPSEIASASEPTEDTTYSARYLANISSLTEAGDYSTILTYTITGTF